jgi:hypothetical protein
MPHSLQLRLLPVILLLCLIDTVNTSCLAPLPTARGGAHTKGSSGTRHQVALDFSQGYNIVKPESKDQSLELDYSHMYQIPFGCASSMCLASYGREGGPP